MVLDLDGFKTINDSLGHTAGDQLLVAAAQRLQNQLRPGDTAARLGGDEFAILLEDITVLEEVSALADRLLDVFRAPFAVAGKQLLVSASLGVAINRPGEGSEELVRNADLAMYLAKSAGKPSPRGSSARSRPIGLRSSVRSWCGGISIRDRFPRPRSPRSYADVGTRSTSCPASPSTR